ncbi:Radial spoke head 10-like protein B [Picochlorum sp. SENEW3]|nr:Radial spoke head 10-like protein B [Picochlorum sp. SENEW3]
MQSSGRRGVDQPESGIDRVKRRTGDSKVDISDVTDDTMTYDASKSEDTVQYAEVREEVRRSVERLRLEVEMASSQREMGGVELSAEALAKGFTCPEDFQIREERIEYGDGVYYEGEVLGKMRHGRGMYRDATGAEYSGEFRYDVVEGKARAKMPDGSTYDGDCRWKPPWDGQEHVSQWGCMKATLKGVTKRLGKDGERVHGKFASHDRSEEYVGEWRGAARHDGSVYEGEFMNGVRCGKGILKRDSFLYQGEWKDDRMHGKGFLMAESGDKYVGEFREGEKDGKGRMQYHSGTAYEGEWMRGNRHGRGTCKYDNGDVYVGDWVDDKRHGRGTCKFKDGTKFRGEWEDDGWVQTAADPQRTRIAGAGIVRAEVGNVAKFMIQGRDAQGNRRLNGGDAFQVQLVLHGECGNPDIPQDEIVSVTGHVTDNDDGTYEVTYCSEISGVYELSVLTEIGQEHVADSPYPVRLLPGAPCYKTSLIRGEGKAWATCGQEAKFEILIRDKFGNCCSGHQWQDLIRLSFRLEGSLSEKHVDCIPTGDGRLLCSYSAPEEEGYYRLHIENEKGIAVPGTPFSVHVSNGQKAAVSQEDQGENSTTIPDTNRFWEQVAMESYMQDGNVAGWDSADDETESPEDNYSKSHPGVPVVENLEDLWLDTFGPGQEPSIDEAQNAMKEIIEGEMKQAVAELQAPDQKNASQGEKKQRDLHDPEEFAGGHIAGSVNVPVWVKDENQQMVPNEAFVQAVEERFPDKEGVKLCVGCLSGKRSDAATTLLVNAGYRNLIDMTEGFSGWALSDREGPEGKALGNASERRIRFVVVDRTNLSKEQRRIWTDEIKRAQGGTVGKSLALFWDMPAKFCAKRAGDRKTHESGLQGRGAYPVVHQSSKGLQRPDVEEDFDSVVTFTCDEHAFAFADHLIAVNKEFKDTGILHVDTKVHRKGRRDAFQILMSQRKKSKKTLPSSSNEHTFGRFRGWDTFVKYTSSVPQEALFSDEECIVISDKFPKAKKQNYPKTIWP